MQYKSIFIKSIYLEEAIQIYRFLAIAFTSAFYFIYETDKSLSSKGIVILLILVSAVLTAWLYEKAKSNQSQIKLLILFETLGISLILIPTGGMDSYFIWYAINPVLISAIYLPTIYCWIFLSFYLSLILTLTYTNFTANFNILSLFSEKYSYIILVFILMTVAFQLISKVSRELAHKNQLLEAAYTQNQESIDHLMSLYQVTESLGSHHSRESLLKTFTEYALNLSKSDLTFIWTAGDEEDEIFSIAHNSMDEEFKNKKISSFIQAQGIPASTTIIEIASKHFMVTPISSNTKNYGVIGVEVSKRLRLSKDVIEKQLTFLANMTAIILDRFQTDKINEKLLLAEEQNRIANEIHDSVSQRLFSIVYAIHSLKKNSRVNDIKEKLDLIKDSSRLAAQELRECVYRLSSKKNQEKNYISSIQAYLEQLSKLSNVLIELDTDENTVRIPLYNKQILFRVISEAAGNAIRHGKAKNIRIRLSIDEHSSYLYISDDGAGFEIKTSKNSGLGLNNMKELVSYNQGRFRLNSKVGSGTNIQIELPHHHILKGGIA
ncbi:hypothetical protein FZC84_17990 [Rossellomorea vietnamensis]|uniref:Oxygen sensor histidine kinase NreB n=1 Tax=Rossellomorea vietnamensis TaxID=218284 RepID=A0A5D4M8C3_9BACI|nr:ATP-binding protein [Rossellomorea vietnamensis]TYR97738.1 hypothetical protein FZC84_17990 [Rossellomorea vietnamensis]